MDPVIDYAMNYKNNHTYQYDASRSRIIYSLDNSKDADNIIIRYGIFGDEVIFDNFDIMSKISNKEYILYCLEEKCMEIEIWKTEDANQYKESGLNKRIKNIKKFMERLEHTDSLH